MPANQYLRPPARNIQQVGTTADKFADNFAGGAFVGTAASLAALQSTNWDVVRNTGGMSITLNNGSLVIDTGTTANAEFLMLGAAQHVIPANLVAVFSISQRIANQEFRFGYLEVDPITGLPIANPNLTNFFQNHAAVLFDGTTATTAILEAVADDAAARRTVSVPSGATTASNAEYTLEVRNEDVTLMSAIADSTAARTVGTGRISSMVPNPAVAYRPFIWVRNLGTAPASTTSMIVNRFVSMDVQELQAEVGNGRGSQTPSGAIPVATVAGANNVTISGTPAVSINNTALSTNTNNASLFRLFSQATTNAALIKGSAGRFYGGQLANTSAAWRYVKFYNKATAPVPGTDTPVLTLAIPPNDVVPIASLFDQYGAFFSLGIGIAITLNAGDADTTVLAVANEVVVNLQFI